jgi:type II secretory pathway component PulF
LGEILTQVKDRVSEGSFLANASTSTGAFSDPCINHSQAGEASGTLDIVLPDLQIFF